MPRASVLEYGAPPPLDDLQWIPQEDQPVSDRAYYPIAPYDKDTGLSHLIAPPEESLNFDTSRTSWHHRQGTETLLQALGELGRGVRTSCIQRTLNADHNFGEHTFHSMTGRPYLPPKATGRVTVIVMNAVNAVTDQVFDPRQGGPRPITAAERQRLFSSGEVRVQSDFAVRRTLTRFAIKRGMQYIQADEVRRFKDAKSEDERLKVVNETLGRFLPLVFKTVDARYQVARAKGFLPASACTSAPEVARQYVFDEPERVELFLKYFNRLMGLDLQTLVAA